VKIKRSVAIKHNLKMAIRRLMSMMVVMRA